MREKRRGKMQLSKEELTQNIVESIERHIPDAVVEVTQPIRRGDHAHLGLSVMSDSFKGKTLLERHQDVMNILAKPLQNELHAIKIKTGLKPTTK